MIDEYTNSASRAQLVLLRCRILFLLGDPGIPDDVAHCRAVCLGATPRASRLTALISDVTP